MSYARQFALPFPQALHYRPEDFFPGPGNADALAWLARPAAWPGGRLALFGESGTGKTHLLHVFAARTGAVLLPAASLRRLQAPPGGVALAIDDAECAQDPRALLHLLNAAAEAGQPVLLAAATPPAQWPYTLPDLTSRLRAITTVRLHAPEDSLLRALLARLFADRQLAVPVTVQDFLLARLPRTGTALREAVARLDRTALAAGRRVSAAMADAVVGEMTEQAEP